MSRDKQVAHMNACRTTTEQVPPNRTGMPTVLEDPNVTPRKPTPYGMQYSPTRLQRTITSSSTSTSNYTNIWGPPISRRDGQMTIVSNEPQESQVNLLRTIKPRIPTGFEDLVVKMITFGAKGNVHVHVLREGKDETWNYTKARMFFPQALGEYIVENELVILKGMEWATAYGLPKTPFYPLGTFGKPCDTDLSKRDRLWVRMNQVTRVGNQQQGIHNSAIKRACATQKRHKLQGKH